MLDLMRGATFVRQSIADHIADQLPDLLTQAREVWGLEDWELPDVEDYQQYDRNELNLWPAIGINVTSARNFGRVDYEADTSQVYLTKYNVDVYTWLRSPMNPDGDYVTPTYDRAIKMRDDYAGIIRNIFLRTPSFGTTTLQFYEETLTEEYGEAIQGKGARWVVGVRHNFVVQNEESTAIAQTVGDAETIIVDGISSETLGGL